MPGPVWAVIWPTGQKTFQPLALRDQTPVRLPPEASFLNILCYVRSGLVDLESCEALHPRRLKNVSDGQCAVASPSVPLDRNVQLRRFLTGLSISTLIFCKILKKIPRGELT